MTKTPGSPSQSGVGLLAQSLRDVIAESQIVVLDAMKPELQRVAH